MQPLSEQEIFECIYPYLMNGEKEMLDFLDQLSVPEKFRIAPKQLYRGIQIRKSAISKYRYEYKKYISFTTSFSYAKDFARGVMGNDYRYRRVKEPIIGIVYSYKPTIDDIVIAIGAFLRRSSIEKIKCFQREHEYLLRGDYNKFLIDKSTIMWKTDRVVYD